MSKLKYANGNKPLTDKEKQKMAIVRDDNGNIVYEEHKEKSNPSNSKKRADKRLKKKLQQWLHSQEKYSKSITAYIEREDNDIFNMTVALIKHFLEIISKTHFITKEYEKAEIILNKSLSHYPMFHTTLASMGELYFDKGDLEKSRNFYERAIKINPFNPFVHVRLLTIYQKLGWEKEKELQAKLFGYVDQQ